MKTLAALAILMFTLAPAQKAPDVTGKWTGGMTRTGPAGQTQTIDWQFNLTQKGKVLTGTTGPTEARQWTIEKGAVDGTKVSLGVQQPDGPYRTFTLVLVKDHLQGKMVAELNGQSFETVVDVERAK
jgi:hypothetical protein